MPLRPSLQFAVHELQLAAETLPLREYGALAGQSTHNPVEALL